MPSVYLFQVFFLIFLSSAIFIVADFYSTDDASINLMLIFFPWVALILVPALMMKSWPDEHSDRSVELVMTLPISSMAIVFGKFFAGYLILLITLLATLPFVITIGYLGEPDFGAVFSGYFGLSLLLGVYCSLSLFCTALVREPVGSFVTSIGLLSVLLLLGWDVFGRFMKESIPSFIVDTIALYSPYTWVTRMGQGIIEMNGLLFFILIGFISLFLTCRVVEQSRVIGTSAIQHFKKFYSLFTFLVLFAVAIPFLGKFPGKIDLTEAKEFTLHKGTKDIISKLGGETKITFFWSASEPSIPNNIKFHAKRIRSLIKELVFISGGSLVFEELDPKPDSLGESEAIARGLKKIPMSSGDSFFLGLTVVEGGRIGNIPYLDVRRGRMLEYDISLVLDGLSRKLVRKIGILSPLVPSVAAVGNREGMSFIAELKQAYDVAIIPHFKDQLPEDLKVLILIDASILKRKMLFSIDQFVMNGGSLIVMIDPHLRFNKASNAVSPKPSSAINDISDLLSKYGLLYDERNVVGNSHYAAMAIDKEQKRFSYPYWMRIKSDGLAASHPTTASLNEVFIVESGSFKILDQDLIDPLIMTKMSSGVVLRENFFNRSPRELTSLFKSDNKPRIIAAAIKGELSSAFQGPLMGTSLKDFHSKSIDFSQVFAIADVDWIFDPFSVQKTDIDGQIIVRPLNDNLTFLLNLIEYASGSSSLIAIRSRGKIERPFVLVQSLVKTAEKEFQSEEMMLSNKIKKIKSHMKNVFKSSGTNNISKLPPDIKSELVKFRDELSTVKERLRVVRYKLRAKVDSLGNFLTILNIMFGPLFVLLFATFNIFVRRRFSLS